MPQLPEVETARRRLSPVLVGRSVEAVPQLDPKLFAGPRDQLEAGVVGRAVRRVGRRGKVLILAFPRRVVC